MRQRYLWLFLVLFTWVSSCKQKEEDALAGIKKSYTAVNSKLKDYKTRRVEDITNPGGGYITGYYRDDEVKKVVAEHFSDTSRTFIEYYFDDGMLIYVLRQDYHYNKPQSYTEEKARANNDSVWYDDKKTRLEINRFYFSKNQMVKWIDGDGNEVNTATARFIDKQSELWGETVILLKQLKEA